MTTSARPCPLSTFRLPASFRLSAPVSRRFLFLPPRFCFLSSASSALPDTQLPVLPFSPPSVPHSQWLPQRPDFRFRFRQIFPFHPVWFPIQSFRFRLLSSLFVSFRPLLLRSHSRSTGAHLTSSLSAFHAMLPLADPFFRPAPFRF